MALCATARGQETTPILGWALLWGQQSGAKRLPKRLPKHLRPATPLHRWKVAQRHYQMRLRLSFVALH